MLLLPMLPVPVLPMLLPVPVLPMLLPMLLSATD